MTDPNHKKIFSTVAPEKFVGRTPELERLRRHAANVGKSPALLVSSAPAVGSTELLKQTFDRLFHEQSGTIPIYFAIKDGDRTANRCAVRFLQTFITQTVAFYRRDTNIFDAAPAVCELAELAAVAGIPWIERLTAARRTENRLNDDRAFIRRRLSAPLGAKAAGANFLVMIDDLHEADFFSGEIDFIEELKEVYSRSSVSFVLAGARCFLLKAILAGRAKLPGAEILPIESLSFGDAKILTENLAAKYAVEINPATADLIAVKLQGNPTFTEFLMQSASERQTNLDSFQSVEQIYAGEIFGGRIGKFYDAVLDKIAPGVSAQNAVLKLFQAADTAGNERFTFENWAAHFDSASPESHRVARLLNTGEIVRWSSNRIEAAIENETLRDYMTARFRLEIKCETRAAVVGETTAHFLKRAPQTMAKFYRQNAAVNLRELLALFNRQDVPLELLDYSIYKEQLETIENATNDLINESKKITLPQMIFTAHAAEFYPAFEQLTEKTRAAVGRGFAARIYTDADETVWLAAEIDAKLEASKETTEFWCDRLEMLALTCDFPKYVIWLVAPEGFAPDAIEVLREKNGYGSSRRQAESLAKFLQGDRAVCEKRPTAEYEIVVPMGDDSELIAAIALEEIARRHRYAPKAINQMKTAVVEACINAAEHSLSPDRKIHQKFRVESDRIVITISNRGLRLADKKAVEIAPDTHRRGWGLKLMKTLMDEVKFEQVDDGTRISMTKYHT